MKQATRHIILLLTFSLLLAVTVAAQRISFGLYATDDIVLTQLNSGELNFNLKQPIILGGETVTVNLSDDAVGILTVEGRKDLDITVTIDAPATLDLEGSNHIPLAIRFAYSNTEASNEANAKARSIEIPAGFTSATFPISRRLSGLPAPPPTPNYAGYIAPRGTVYLFVYGTLGPVPSNAAAGLYTGNINIHVEYAK
jgi:hypothetical protein